LTRQPRSTPGFRVDATHGARPGLTLPMICCSEHRDRFIRPSPSEPFRKVGIQAERFVEMRRSMIRIMARRMKAAALRA
jgi:hypothetical protein